LLFNHSRHGWPLTYSSPTWSLLGGALLGRWLSVRSAVPARRYGRIGREGAWRGCGAHSSILSFRGRGRSGGARRAPAFSRHQRRLRPMRSIRLVICLQRRRGDPGPSPQSVRGGLPKSASPCTGRRGALRASDGGGGSKGADTGALQWGSSACS